MIQGYVIQLYKKVNMQNHIFPKEYGQNIYYTLGYYDAINPIPFSDPKELYAITCTESSAVEQAVIFSHNGNSVITFESMMLVSFLMIREPREKGSLLLLARDIENNLNGLLAKRYKDKVVAHAFASAGASAIGVIFSVMDFDIQGIQSALHVLRDGYCSVSSVKNEVTYSFSMIAFKSDLTQEALGQKSLENLDYLLPSVRFSFVNPPENSPLIHTLIGMMSKALGPGAFEYYQVPGADDFELIKQDVPLRNLLSLYLPGGILDAGTPENPERVCSWYGFCCESVFTTVLFDKNSCVFEDYTELSQKLRSYVLSNIRQIENDGYHIDDTIGKRHPQTALYIKRHLRAFEMLKKSSYTRVLYQIYRPVVNQFIGLLKMSLEINSIKRYDYSIDFFHHIEHAIETMLNTSTYFTDSPGFKPVEDHSFPRLLIAYTNLVNSLASECDARTLERHKGNGRPIPSHLFLLTLHGTEEVCADKYCHQLPPDSRLGRILIPVGLAHQPAMLLPLLLHEVGHFIGVRHRNRRHNGLYARERYYFRLLTFRICAWLYRNIVQRLYDHGEAASDHDFNNFWYSDASDAKKALASYLLGMLQYVQPKFEDQLYELYLIKKRALIDAFIDDDSIENRYKQSINYSYFDQMCEIASACLMQWLPLAMRFFEVHTGGYLYLDQQRSLRTRTEIKKSIMVVLQGAVNRIFYDPSLVTSWISEAKSLLSEPVVDIYMVKTLGMSILDYLCVVFEHWLTPDLTESKLMERLSTSAAQTRILAVLYALDHERCTNIKDIAEGSVYAKERIKAKAVMHGTFGNNNFEKYYSLFEEFLRQLSFCYEDFRKYMNIYEETHKSIELGSEKEDLYQEENETDWFNRPAHLFDLMNMQLTIASYVRETAEDSYYDGLQESYVVTTLKDLFTSAKDCLVQESLMGIPSMSSVLDKLYGFLPVQL